MKILKIFILCIVVLCFAGCSHIPTKQRDTTPWVGLSLDNSGFALSNGKRFRPWGFNYDRDYKMQLLEDYWDADWGVIEADFKEMRNLGANVVRIHLQFGKFMDSPTQPNKAALDHLEKLLELAECNGLYLDLTGLGCYRKACEPAWYSELNEPKRWAAQSVFWEAIAKSCQNSAAVFCYDLMNEPVVPTAPRRTNDWLVAQLLDLWYVQSITLDPAERNRTELACQWIQMLSNAIKKHDKRHLITVGMLPNSLEDPISESGFVPARVANYLDFISIHIYPGPASLEKDLRTIEGFDTGKPLVVEEIFPLNAGLDLLQTFMQRSAKHVDGWIGFYWGQTPEELALSKDISAAITGAWLRFFQERAPEYTE